MRIAMVGPFGFHPNKTMRSRALPLAKALVRRGHKVKMVMPPWQTPEEAGKSWEDEGVILNYVGLGGGYLGISAQLVREVRGWKPDAAHTFKPKAFSGLVSWWLWNFHRRQIKLVTDTDDWEGDGGWNDVASYTSVQKRFFNWQEKWGYGHCHGLTVASRELESRALAFELPEHSVFYLPNGPGIPPESKGSSGKRSELGLEDRPVLLLYSRLFEFDSERLVAILARVRDSLPDLAILAVGLSLFESDAAVFREALVANGLEGAIVDVGWVEESELPSYLGAADVGIYLMDDTVLNRAKCPVKLADMLALGLPVVAEDVGQVSEYVLQSESGLLRQSGDVTGVASDILTLMQDRDQRERLGEGARRHIDRHFSWDRLAETAEEAYERALKSER